ncbi:2,4-dienoyl-CoA reductase [Nonomuraea solani]|uniref:2,4-dienoyl-CoA reductase n=1 Tax=Nonomuraea solani TaxID=1144553 RepID=A0A1H6EWV2_9ACTN|nr:NADH:flavin oxidoreductase [Nonomuraea solani]SEH01154.1 2,4-dienoyl-CoA reductase [Nonomuraea solani]
MTSVELKAALQPIRLGRLDLPNRLAVSPMTRVSAAPDGTPTSEMIDYYARYATGGFGLVITEGTYTDAVHSQGYLNQPGIVSAEHVAAWRGVADAVHAAGARVVLQLMHAGALSQGNRYRTDTAGPSAVPPVGRMLPEYGGSGPWPTPREMTGADIEAAIGGFVDSAVRAREAGFDGVELHGANGYLLDQFLTEYTNHRTDSYGGPVTNRIRLTAQVVAAIRDELGADFPVGVRLSQGKVNDFTHRWAGGAADARIVFGTLAGAGATYLHIASEGRDWNETARLDGGVTITGLARQVTGLPVIANGGMHDLAQAAQVLSDGHADLLSIGRGALANPDLPDRLSRGLPLEPYDRRMLEPMATLDNARRWLGAMT